MRKKNRRLRMKPLIQMGFQATRKKVFDVLYKDLIEKAEKQPNITIGVLVYIVIIILTVFFRLIFGGKKQPIVEKKPEVTETFTSGLYAANIIFLICPTILYAANIIILNFAKTKEWRKKEMKKREREK